MGGINDPKALVLAYLAPGKVAGRAEKSHKELALVSRVKGNESHSALNVFCREGNYLVLYILMIRVSPPNEDVGVGKDLFGERRAVVIRVDLDEAHLVFL